MVRLNKKERYLYNKHWRKTHKEKCRQYDIESGKYYQKLLNELKLDMGCAICGYNKCSLALAFHHVESKYKKCAIGYLWLRRRFPSIQEEIAKCVLLCANCHSEIHYKDNKSFKGDVE